MGGGGVGEERRLRGLLGGLRSEEEGMKEKATEKVRGKREEAKKERERTEERRGRVKMGREGKRKKRREERGNCTGERG